MEKPERNLNKLNPKKGDVLFACPHWCENSSEIEKLRKEKKAISEERTKIHSDYEKIYEKKGFTKEVAISESELLNSTNLLLDKDNEIYRKLSRLEKLASNEKSFLPF